MSPDDWNGPVRIKADQMSLLNLLLVASASAKTSSHDLEHGRGIAEWRPRLLCAAIHSGHCVVEDEPGHADQEQGTDQDGENGPAQEPLPAFDRRLDSGIGV